MKDNNILKESFLKSVRPELSEMSYNTWFVPVSIHGTDEEAKTIYLTAENDFAANILKSRYIDTIESGFRNVMKERYKVVIKTPESYRHDDETLERVNEIKNENPFPAEKGTGMGIRRRRPWSGWRRPKWKSMTRGRRGRFV